MLKKDSFKSMYNLEQRKTKSSDLLKKYPEVAPIIIEKYSSSKITEELKKNKFLISKKEQFSTLATIIRKYLSLDKSKALFFYVNNKIINQTDLISDLYSKYIDEDGFLYIEYAYENTFG